MKAHKTQVLIVEDSPVMQEMLAHLLDGDSETQVLAIARDGPQALEILQTARPDVITVDIHMPGMDGFELTRRIMETQPVPVVIVSASWRPEEVAMTFRALEAGAVAIVGKPEGPGHPRHDEESRKLLQTVKTMAEVKVVKRWARARHKGAPSPASSSGAVASPIRLVAIGSSTGGPVVLQNILMRLPRDFPAPVVIVQHIAAGFLQGLTDWLTTTTGFPVHVAKHGETLLPSNAYLAPDSFHTEVSRDSRIALVPGPPEFGLRPSVAHLFASVARAFGPNAAGVLLTGMGRDGAEELKLMHDKGALTIVQDRESSVVFGMPGEAVKLGAAGHVLNPEAIAALLTATVIKG